MSPKRNDLWSCFFKEECGYLEWLETHSSSLYYSGLETIRYLTVDMGTGPLLRHQKYLRHIRVADNFSAAQDRSQSMFQAFRNAFLADKPNSQVRYPIRFPTFLRDVSRITVFTREAWSSVSLKNRETHTLINTYSLIDGSASDAVAMAISHRETLLASGMHSARLDQLIDELRLTVSESDIVTYFGCNAIQKRLPTGTSYNARVTFGDEHVETHALNLLVLDAPASIYHPNPRKKRQDAYLLEDALEFPVSTPYYFFYPITKQAVIHD
ncbi:hypothetical protein ACPFUC_001913 [Vibrio cholerae]